MNQNNRAWFTILITQNVAPTMYAGLKANNLVNFYNSNLLDEMLQKN